MCLHFIDMISEWSKYQADSNISILFCLILLKNTGTILGPMRILAQWLWAYEGKNQKKWKKMDLLTTTE